MIPWFGAYFQDIEDMIPMVFSRLPEHCSCSGALVTKIRV